MIYKMFHAIALTNIIKLYYLIRTMHGIYISYQFITWFIVSMYGSFCWIIYYIPKPSLQLGYKEMYYAIDDGEYIDIIKINDDVG